MAETLDPRPVTVELRNVPFDDALSAIARRAGVQVSRQGGLYFLGQLRREDRAFLVRRVRRLDRDSLSEVVATILSDVGDQVAQPDGLLVVADRVEVLGRVHDLLDSVERAETPTWCVQLHLVALSAEDVSQLGIEATPALEISAAFARASGPGMLTGIAPQSSLNAGLAAVLEAARRRSSSSLVAEPLFLLVDGSSAELVRGARVPIPRRTVSDQGTTTTQGYDFVQTGLQFGLTLREVSDQSARLALELTSSEISDYVEGAPVTLEERFSGESVVTSGGVYLLGSITRSESRRNDAVGFRTGGDQSEGGRVLQIWCRATRVGAIAGSQTGSPPILPGSEISLPPGGTPGVELLPPVDPDPLPFDQSAAIGDFPVPFLR